MVLLQLKSGSRKFALFIMLSSCSFKTKAVFFQDFFFFFTFNQGHPGPKGRKGEPVFAQGSLKGMKVRHKRKCST